MTHADKTIFPPLNVFVDVYPATGADRFAGNHPVYRGPQRHVSRARGKVIGVDSLDLALRADEESVSDCDCDAAQASSPFCLCRGWTLKRRNWTKMRRTKKMNDRAVLVQQLCLAEDVLFWCRHRHCHDWYQNVSLHHRERSPTK